MVGNLRLIRKWRASSSGVHTRSFSALQLPTFEAHVGECVFLVSGLSFLESTEEATKRFHSLIVLIVLIFAFQAKSIETFLANLSAGKHLA